MDFGSIFIYIRNERRKPVSINKSFKKLEGVIKNWKKFYDDFKKNMEYVLETPTDDQNLVRLKMESHEREFFNYVAILGNRINRKAKNVFEEKKLFEQGLISEQDMSNWVRSLTNEINEYANEYWKISTGIETAIEESKQGRYLAGF
jgi:hypothetical protein